MNARQLLQVLKSALEREVALDEEISLSISPTATSDKASAIITIPVENATRIVEISAKDLGIYSGLEAPNAV